MFNPFGDHENSPLKLTQNKRPSSYQALQNIASETSLTTLTRLPCPICAPHPSYFYCPQHSKLFGVLQHISYTPASRLLLFSLLKHCCMAQSLTFFKSLLTIRSRLAPLYNIESVCPNPCPRYALSLLPYRIFFYSNYQIYYIWLVYLFTFCTTILILCFTAWFKLHSMV